MISMTHIEDLICPLIVCDTCTEPMLVGNPGNVLWSWDAPTAIYSAHKGHCTRALEAEHGRMAWRDLHEWFAQLTYNVTHPLSEGLDPKP